MLRLIFSYGMVKHNKCILLMAVNNEHLFVAWEEKTQGNCPEGKEMLAFETEYGQNPKLDLSSFMASGDFCRLLITFANRPVGSDLDQNRLIL